MKKFTEKEILALAEQTIKKIKNSNDNPYKNLSFVNEIFKSQPKIIDDVKNILKGNFKGNLTENLFKGKELTKAQHFYNFLYENNLLSKYDEVADYMNFPNITQLNKKKV